MGAESFLTLQIADFAEGVDDRVAALLQAGTGITLTYNDGANTLTIANTGLGGSTGSTDNRVLRADGTGGSTVQNSAVTIDDSGNISGLGTVTCGALSATNVTVNSGFRVTHPDGNTANFAFYNTLNRIQFSVNVNRGITIAENMPYAWSAGADPSATAPDLFLHRDGAGCMSQRNAANAQTSRLYNTFTSSANGEWLQSQWSSNEARIGTAVGSAGGTQRNTVLGVWNSSNTWTAALTIATTGNVTASALFFAGVYTVATLPSAAANAGALAQVTDSSVTTNGSAVSGGGSNRVVVFSNGSTWDVVVA